MEFGVKKTDVVNGTSRARFVTIPLESNEISLRHIPDQDALTTKENTDGRECRSILVGV